VFSLPVPPPTANKDAWIAEIGYLSGAPGRVRVSYGGAETEVALRAGLRRVFVPVQGRGPILVITPIDAVSGLCVGGAAVGTPTPRP
jgi:hypothetical protein